MALTAIEQLKIIAGNPSPDEADLLSLIQQSATMLGVNFTINIKDTTGNDPATAYKNKFNSVISRVFSQDTNAISSLRRILIVLLGNTSFTFAQVQNATDADWMAFVYANMDESFEFLSGITAEEKSSYLAI